MGRKVDKNHTPCKAKTAKGKPCKKSAGLQEYCAVHRTPSGKPRRNGGKRGSLPSNVIDLDLVRKLAQIHCTMEEIAAIMGIARETLSRDDEASEIFRIGKEEGKASIRRQQWKLAQDGHPTMLIWLGKQLLGQSDKTESTHTGPGGLPMQVQILLPDNRRVIDGGTVGAKRIDNNDD